MSRRGFRSYPRHLQPADGRGIMECARTGFLRKPDDMVKNSSGQMVARDFIDYTPGFGTRHPQDVPQPEIGGDPSPIPNATGVDKKNLSRFDLRISDEELLAAIKEDRPPRPGY